MSDFPIIGLLNEGELHSRLKEYFEPNSEYHEIPCMGFVADILRDDTVTEIETCSFSNVKKKIKPFLQEYKLNIVYPLAIKRWVAFVNSETGEIGQRKKSTRPARLADMFRELYKIKEYLLLPNFSVTVVEAEIVEIKCRERRPHKLNRIPLEFLGTHQLKTVEDYRNAVNLPTGLFCANDFGRLNKMRRGDVWYALSVLCTLGIIELKGKKGKAYLYEEIR